MGVERVTYAATFGLAVAGLITLGAQAQGGTAYSWLPETAIADNSVLPERGNPEMKWNLLGGVRFWAPKVICNFSVPRVVMGSVTRPGQ